MRATLTIAFNSFQEAIRRKVLVIILIIASILIACANVFSYLSPGEEEKFIADFGMGAILLAGILMAIFLGATLIPAEVERKTIFILLSKPVRKGEFVLGKFLGMLMTIFLCVLLMSVVFIAVYFYKKHAIPANLLWALLLMFFEIAVVASIAVTISIVGSMAFNIVFSFLIYFLGASSSSLLTVAEDVNIVLRGLLKTIYWIIPHLDYFDVRQKLITEDIIRARDVSIYVLYGIGYTMVVVLLAWFFFRDREF